ncbi:hypothetical protein R6Q59_018923 [Mikania micrantha]
MRLAPNGVSADRMRLVEWRMVRPNVSCLGPSYSPNEEVGSPLAIRRVRVEWDWLAGSRHSANGLTRQVCVYYNEDGCTGISKTKKRGPTMLHVVHTRIEDEREVIICNEFGQPVGHVREGKDVVGKFSRFLGTIARNNTHAPLIHSSWQKVPHKQKIWEYVLKRCARAKQSRMSQKNMHTAGPKSFARIQEEMKNDDPNQKTPTLTQLFERTRKRTEGRTYVDIYDDTTRKIEQMKSYKITENDNTTIDPFLVVMNKENYGYRRLYGRGVTNTMIKKLDGASTSYIIPDGLMESFKANVDVEKNQLIEMRKEIEDDHERKKAELEAMREDIDSQRQNLEAMMQKVFKQLPLGDSKD